MEALLATSNVIHIEQCVTVMVYAISLCNL